VSYHAIEADGHDHHAVELAVQQRTANHNYHAFADPLDELGDGQRRDIHRRTAEKVAHREPDKSEIQRIAGAETGHRPNARENAVEDRYAPTYAGPEHVVVFALDTLTNDVIGDIRKYERLIDRCEDRNYGDRAQPGPVSGGNCRRR